MHAIRLSDALAFSLTHTLSAPGHCDTRIKASSVYTKNSYVAGCRIIKREYSRIDQTTPNTNTNLPFLL